MDTMNTPTPVSWPAAATRSHRNVIEMLAKAASVVCAGGAGIGVATGLLSPDDGTLTGIVVPVVVGTVVVAANGIGWHMVHTAATRVRTPFGYVAVTVVGIGLSLATIGASSWAIATTLSGHAAVRQDRSEAVASHQQALNAAWAQAGGEGAMIDAVSSANAELRALSAMEARGGMVSNHGSGDGANSSILAAGAEGYARLEESMRTLQEKAAREFETGEQAIGQMRLSVHGDAATFEAAASKVETVVADLNAYRLTDLANKAGLVQVDVWSNDQVVDRVRSGAEKVSAKVLERGKEIAHARQIVPVPAYVPREPRELTWQYAGGAAAGGWITAIAIDLLPFLFAVLLLSTHAQTRLDDKVRRGADDHDDGPTAAAPVTPLIWPRSGRTS